MRCFSLCLHTKNESVIHCTKKVIIHRYFTYLTGCPRQSYKRNSYNSTFVKMLFFKGSPTKDRVLWSLLSQGRGTSTLLSLKCGSFTEVSILGQACCLETEKALCTNIIFYHQGAFTFIFNLFSIQLSHWWISAQQRFSIITATMGVFILISLLLICAK